MCIIKSTNFVTTKQIKVMNKIGNVSKVAICEKCKSYVLASHVDFITKSSEKDFTFFSNNGFTVKI